MNEAVVFIRCVETLICFCKLNCTEFYIVISGSLISNRAMKYFTKNRLGANDRYEYSVLEVAATFTKILPPNIYLKSLQTAFCLKPMYLLIFDHLLTFLINFFYQ